MSHALNARLWANIDDKRSGSALVAEMTPLSLDSQAAQASFAGSSEMYWADLEKCTCMDFNINQSRSAPCKHMIRLAMELGLLPSAGIVRDIDAAQYRVALAKLKSMTSEGDLLAEKQAIESLLENGRALSVKGGVLRLDRLEAAVVRTRQVVHLLQVLRVCGACHGGSHGQCAGE